MFSKKRLVVSALVMALVLSITGCTKTTTMTYTDADGNSTTTTETTNKGGTTKVTENTDADGNVVSHEQDGYVTASIRFENYTGIDLYGIYITADYVDNWGENILKNEDEPLASGEFISWNDAFTYSENDLIWDVRIVDGEGEEIDFTGLDVSNAEDKYNIVFTFEYSEAEGYTASVIGPTEYQLIESPDGYSLSYNPEFFELYEPVETEGIDSTSLTCIIDEENKYENYIDVLLVTEYSAQDLVDGIALQTGGEVSETHLVLANGEYDAFCTSYNVSDTFCITTYIIPSNNGAYKIEIGSHIYSDEDEYAYPVSGALDDVLLSMEFDV